MVVLWAPPRRELDFRQGRLIFRGLDLDFPKAEPRVSEGGVMIFRRWYFAFIERMETRFFSGIRDAL